MTEIRKTMRRARRRLADVLEVTFEAIVDRVRGERRDQAPSVLDRACSACGCTLASHSPATGECYICGCAKFRSPIRGAGE